MSDPDLGHALALLDHQQRLIERLTAEATELRAEVKIWQTRTLQLLDRVLLPAPAVEPEPPKPPRWGQRAVCTICTLAFITAPGYTKICRVCRKAQGPITPGETPATGAAQEGQEGSVDDQR